jgi:DNA adenine methylase
MILRAPFPWFGGKRRVADVVWDRFGDVPNYVEPFAGSLAVLLGRPHEPRAETVNDLDCYLANFWRAVQHAPDQVAEYADAPVNEADLHARHQWLVDRAAFREAMKADPEHYDAKVAGWWVWGISQWIGSGWCRNAGTDRPAPKGKTPDISGRHGAPNGRGVTAKRPLLVKGTGVHRTTVTKRPRLGRGGRGVTRQMPCLHGDSGATGRGVHASALEDRGGLYEWFDELAARLRRVRVCCGDWKRILGPSPTTCIGTTAVFLDPPYAVEDRAECYRQDDFDVANSVRAWALAHGDDPALRIALCGYHGEHDDLVEHGWTVHAWKASGGYAARAAVGGAANNERERIWFSPHCLENGGAGHQERWLA